MRILVVEDDPLIREFVVEAQREEGYEAPVSLVSSLILRRTRRRKD